MKKWERKVEMVANWVLSITGGFGIIAGFIELVSAFSNVNLSFFEGFTIFTLGLISLGLGLERMITYARLETVIDNGIELIKLNSWDEIYFHVSSLIPQTREQIRATAFGHGKWVGPPDYLKDLVNIAKQRNKDNEKFVYKIVFGFQGLPDQERAKHIVERKNLFVRKNVEHMLAMRKINEQWGLDLLIIDQHTLIVAIHQYESINIGTGFMIKNQPEFIQSFSTWFDHRIWDQGLPISEKDFIEYQNIAK